VEPDPLAAAPARRCPLLPSPVAVAQRCISACDPDPTVRLHPPQHGHAWRWGPDACAGGGEQTRAHPQPPPRRAPEHHGCRDQLRAQGHLWICVQAQTAAGLLQLMHHKQDAQGAANDHHPVGEGGGWSGLAAHRAGRPAGQASPRGRLAFCLGHRLHSSRAASLGAGACSTCRRPAGPPWAAAGPGKSRTAGDRAHAGRDSQVQGPGQPHGQRAAVARHHHTTRGTQHAPHQPGRGVTRAAARGDWGTVRFWLGGGAASNSVTLSYGTF
jgi:hypothetical protein